MKKILSPKPARCNLQRVIELMNPNRAGWNIHLLKQLFNDSEIQSITKIPISALGMADRLVWDFTKNGQYLVKSGYKVVQQCENQAWGNEGTSNKRLEEEGKL